ncbi:MAG TPA: hypothetical protein VMM36_00010 [Opitutaceae bacterium]|nr:hypothetical protein [Opitutaceae bacterium]
MINAVRKAAAQLPYAHFSEKSRSADPQPGETAENALQRSSRHTPERILPKTPRIYRPAKKTVMDAG